MAPLVASMLVAGPALLGCSASGTSAQDAAARFASALSTGQVAAVAGAPAQQQLTDIVRGMDGLAPTVVAGHARTQGDGGSVALHLTWPLPSGPWSYDTTATLARQAGAWHVAWSPAALHPRLSATTRLVHQRLRAPRADITDPDGHPLMTYRPVTRVGIDKHTVAPKLWDSSAARLAALLRINPTSYRAKVAAAGPEAFVEALTVRGAPDDDDAPRVSAVPGAVLVADRRVLAPTREFAAGILGSVGEASAQQVAESGGRLAGGDEVGQSGLEARYDRQLRGAPGDAVLLRSSAGAPDSQLLRRDPTPGTPLRTTLRLESQDLAQKVLAHTRPASALVAIDPSTGEVSAAATGPGNADGSDATTGRYAPGSTFKTVTALALLRSGMTPDTQVTCSATVDVDGRRFKNYNDFPAAKVGRMPLREAIALSCNTALIAEHARLDAASLQRAAASLGLGQDYDAGLPMFLGQVPDPTNLPVGLAEAMIGQGTVEVSPLAMATVAASVQAGHTVRPVLLPDHHAAVPTAPPLTAREASELRDMLHAVVTDGSGRFLRGIADGAKTGTAEYGTATPPRTHAWMIAYDQRTAVAVMVADGDSGSGTAGPLVEAYLR